MKVRRVWFLVLALAFLVGFTGGQAVGGDSGVETTPPGDEWQAATEIPCSPVNISWPSTSSSRIAGPELAVVRTDLRPKNVGLYLDGRYVGRARFFNGKKGFLYLKPGRYRLMAWDDRLQAATFSIDARPGCRFDIKHRMLKATPGEPQPGVGAPRGKGEPEQWIYGPVGGADLTGEAGRYRGGGPDPSLRPDLAERSSTAASQRLAMASVRLDIRPAAATVFLDGRMLATGAELSRMVQPLAVPAGAHTLVVRAPGFIERTVSFEVEAGAVQELEIWLEPIDSG